MNKAKSHNMHLEILPSPKSLKVLYVYVTIGNNITLLCHPPGKLTQGQHFVAQYLPENTKCLF